MDAETGLGSHRAWGIVAVGELAAMIPIGNNYGETERGRSKMSRTGSRPACLSLSWWRCIFGGVGNWFGKDEMMFSFIAAALRAMTENIGDTREREMEDMVNYRLRMTGEGWHYYQSSPPSASEKVEFENALGQRFYGRRSELHPQTNIAGMWWRPLKQIDITPLDASSSYEAQSSRLNR